METGLGRPRLRLHLLRGAAWKRLKESPCARYAFQTVLTAISELDAGAGDEVLDGRGDEDLTRVSVGGDPGTDVNGEAGQLAFISLALSRVNPDSQLEPKLVGVGNECLCTADRSRRTVEGGEEAVAGRVHLLASEET